MGRQAETNDPSWRAAQGRAIEVMATGGHVARAAEAAGVDPDTIGDWLSRDAQVIAGLNRARREQAERLRADVRALSAEASRSVECFLTTWPRRKRDADG